MMRNMVDLKLRQAKRVERRLDFLDRGGSVRLPPGVLQPSEKLGRQRRP